MAFSQGTQSVEIVPGRRVIVSAGTGATNIEDLQWLGNTVLEQAKNWEKIGWAYIADCTMMEPVQPHEASELVSMTKKFVAAGCRAFGFAEGDATLLKIQAKSNTKRSETGVLEAHFTTVQEALDWVYETVHM